MLSENNPHSNRFKELLGEIKQEVDSLKATITRLEKKNTSLKGELKKLEEKQADALSSLNDTERITLKHQVKGLIAKIDEHLEEQA